MKIEVEAKIILQVLTPKPGETAAAVALSVEQQLNLDAGVVFTPTHPRVGVRFHFNKVKEVT